MSEHGRIRRRATIAVVVLAIVGAVGGSVALRAAKRDAVAPKDQPVALQFVAGDVVYVERRPLDRWLPVSGTLQAVRQAVVKAKVAGDVEGLTVREGETVRGGQKLARIKSPDLEARLIDRQGALESARAQLALAEKTRAMNLRLLSDKFISQNAFDGTESTYSVARG
ncbi:MAG TPA: biotin/lipoyl-binding protein, partial [Casimicrobiaceae bacterium]